MLALDFDERLPIAQTTLIKRFSPIKYLLFSIVTLILTNTIPDG